MKRHHLRRIKLIPIKYNLEQEILSSLMSTLPEAMRKLAASKLPGSHEAASRKQNLPLHDTDLIPDGLASQLKCKDRQNIDGSYSGFSGRLEGKPRHPVILVDSLRKGGAAQPAGWLCMAA